MTSTNLNIVLTNALCCISAQAVKVSKLYSIGDKCADSELQKLKLMNDWFEILRCYTIDPIIAKYGLRLTYDEYLSYSTGLTNINRNYLLIVNGITYTFSGDGVTTQNDAYLSLIMEAIPTAVYTPIIDPLNDEGDRFVILEIDTACDTESIIAEVRLKSNNNLNNTFLFNKYQQGYCSPENCLTETEFNTIVAKLMKECDICECQLT